MSDSPAAGVRIEEHARHLRLVVDRPPVNAFTVPMYDLLTELIGAHCDDPRPLLVLGANDIFSAGFDMGDVAGSSGEPEVGPELETVTRAAVRCLAAVESHPAPVVAAVERAAVGFGLLLAAVADVLVLSEAARIGMPEVRHGMVSEPGPLRRHLPPAWVRRICLGGELHRVADMSLAGSGIIHCGRGEAVKTATALVEVMGSADAADAARIKQRLQLL
ncbi:enoyl-CoA hydratase/isomerase family protein [Streptosporangium sp. NPDC002544]|uniref:enoyl-CoA hydratase/isomerase family protein n=1 Tax=unclassified Streptosporangium TaxID=2632669 RepID=UPI00332AA263